LLGTGTRTQNQNQNQNQKRRSTYIFDHLLGVCRPLRTKTANAMNTPKQSSHPRTCRTCHGSGWQPGEPIGSQHHGKSFDYQTVTPCTHEWRDDDPTVDEYGLDTTEPITFDQYYARLLARHARGTPGSDVELDGWDRYLDTGIIHDA
jgi:hypothetical protein